MYNVNPMNIIQAIRQGQNPEQLLLSIMENQMGGTPFGANLIQLAKQNKTGDIEQIARNLFAARGLDFDKEFKAFRDNLNL